MYASGDVLALNCTSGKSHPAAQLRWFVNGQQVSAIVYHPFTFLAASGQLSRGAEIFSASRISSVSSSQIEVKRGWINWIHEQENRTFHDRCYIIVPLSNGSVYSTDGQACTKSIRHVCTTLEPEIARG